MARPGPGIPAPPFLKGSVGEYLKQLQAQMHAGALNLLDLEPEGRVGLPWEIEPARQTTPEEVAPSVHLTLTVARFVQSTKNVVILYGPTGEGKTVAGVCRSLRVAADNPACWPLRVLCIRDTWTNIRRTTIPSIKQGHARGWWRAEFLEGETRCLLNHGLVDIDFLGLDNDRDANKLQGLEPGLIWLEEPAPAADLMSGIPASVMALAVTRLRQWGVVDPSIQITMNPPDSDHWTMQIAEQLEEAGHPDLTVEVLRIPPGENRHLPEAYRSRMRVLLDAAGRQDLIRRMVEGQIGVVTVGEPVAPEFSDEHIAKEPLEIVRGWATYRFWDFGLCCDASTEILTEHGWALFPDLPRGVRVATRNMATGALEYELPTAYIRRRHTGVMYRYASQNVDMLVTPEHELPMYREDGRYERVPVSRLAAMRHPHHRLPLTVRWDGKAGNPLGWSDEIYAGFMGWYLAEGSVQRTKRERYRAKDGSVREYLSRPGTVVIYQASRRPDVEALLTQTGVAWKPVYWRGEFVGWSAWSPALVTYLADLGTAREKFVPTSVKALPAAAIQTFLDAFIAGDGHRRNRGHGEEVVAFTASRRLADDLQELALKAGHYARLIWRGPCDRTITDRDGRSHVARSRGGWVVSFKRKSHYAHLDDGRGRRGFTRATYDGCVYCVTVPNGTIYVRRNGIAHWTGNSPTCIWAQVTPLGGLNILGMRMGSNMGVEELIESHVIPWEQKYGIVAPRRGSAFGSGARAGFKIRDIGDPAGYAREQSSSERSARKSLENLLRTQLEKGPVEWSARRDAVKAVLSRMIRGRPMLQIDPDPDSGNDVLIRSLRGGWRYAKYPSGRISPEPIKDQWSHSGDALGYGCATLWPTPKLTEPPTPTWRPPTRWYGSTAWGR